MQTIGKPLYLECGDPRYDPASFTRFVLPFAYRPIFWPLQAIQGQQSDSARIQYKECFKRGRPQPDPSFLQARRDYFTPEVGSVLFESAKWIEIDSDAWGLSSWARPIELECRGEKIEVSLLPPRMALFEWPTNIKKPETRQGKIDIFQTGFLMLDLYFPESRGDKSNRPELDDLLVINDLFRHFRCPYEGHTDGYRRVLGKIPFKYEWDGANDEWEGIGYPGFDLKRIYTDRWSHLLAFPVEIDGHFWQLVSSSFHERPGTGPNWTPEDEVLIYADQRTYVWSAAIMNDGAKSISGNLRTCEWRAHEFGHWVKFLNVDSPRTFCPTHTHHDAMAFERNWAEERTYHRWEERGRWYGFSYHSGVMMAPGKKSGIPFWRHFRHMYFDIALLLLYMRITLFRFSRQLTGITDMTHIDDPRSHDRFQRLRGAFSTFTIRYQFPLLSNQQQAIEMYSLARENFDIDDFHREIKQEIDNTHEFIEAVHQRQLSETATKLAQWGIPIGIGALVASIFGMNAKDFKFLHWIQIYRENPDFSFHWGMTSLSLFILIVLVVFAVGIGFGLVKVLFKEIHNRKV